MNYLIDTCVISELVKKEPNKRVVDWISGVPEDRLYLSVLSLGEIKKGITKLQDSRKKKKLIEWLEHDVCMRFDERILPLDDEVLLEWGRITGEAEVNGRPVPVIDSLFAATAICSHMIFVTRNVDDVVDLGAEIINPWES